MLLPAHSLHTSTSDWALPSLCRFQVILFGIQKAATTTTTVLGSGGMSLNHALELLGTDEGEDADILIDRVQQYSEKRTCITATSTSVGDPRFRRRDSSGVGEEEEERISSLGCRQYDSLSEIADLPEVQDRSRFFVPGSATYGSCFNSVKKKQLERLQKRSDWFLSPPAGLRNSGMMRVDLPTTPEASRNPSKVSKGVNGEEVSRTCGTPEPPAHLRRKPSNRQPQQQNPPADAWATSGPPLYTNSHIPSSSRQFTLASSPYANADASCSARRGADGIADASSANHASEDELLETRYFVAVKYYGPGPASSSQSPRSNGVFFTPTKSVDGTSSCTPVKS
uniref:Rho-GAP domain-containing protein n=1 Tax=Mesocestoides corti TaxID=53468 RepID=A0A5K3FN57_MESCO